MDISFTRYAAGGSKAQDGVHFGVDDFANLPDADAGTDLAGCYRSDPHHRRIRQSTEKRKIPMPICLGILAVVLIGCVLSYCVRTYARAQAQDEINRMLSSMNKTRLDNQVLLKQVEEAQDLSRIGYIAVKQLGMVASGDQNNVVMYMPEIEMYAGSLAEQDGVPAQENVTTAASVSEDEAMDNARAGK